MTSAELGERTELRRGKYGRARDRKAKFAAEQVRHELMTRQGKAIVVKCQQGKISDQGKTEHVQGRKQVTARKRAGQSRAGRSDSAGQEIAGRGKSRSGHKSRQGKMEHKPRNLPPRVAGGAERPKARQIPSSAPPGFVGF